MCFRNWYESYRNLRSAHFHQGCLICVLHLFYVHSDLINLTPNQSDHQHQIFQHNIPQWSSSYPPPCYSAPSQELSPPRLVNWRSWELYVVDCIYTHVSVSLYSSAVSSQCLHLQPEPHLRGPVVVAVSSNSDYNDGYTKGQNKANKIWENNYGSDYCYKISKYDTKIQNYISNNYDVNSYSDKYNFKKGAAAGMMDAMKQHDSECDSGGGGDYDNNDFTKRRSYIVQKLNTLRILNFIFSPLYLYSSIINTKF